MQSINGAVKPPAAKDKVTTEAFSSYRGVANKSNYSFHTSEI